MVKKSRKKIRLEIILDENTLIRRRLNRVIQENTGLIGRLDVLEKQKENDPIQSFTDHLFDRSRSGDDITQEKVLNIKDCC